MSATPASSPRRGRRRRALLAAALFTAALALAIGACGGPPPPRAILLIVVDTLRADHLGLYGYERPTSPELDRWAERGRVFDNALATAPWTLPTFASILTGELPSTHRAGRSGGRRGVHRGLGGALPTVAERLAVAGHATGAIVNSSFLREQFGLARGFESYDYRRGRQAEEVVDLALEWLQERAGEPCFLLLHFMDPHRPYEAPAPMAGRFRGVAELPEDLGSLRQLRRLVPRLSSAERQAMIGAYDEEVAYTDRALGRLFGALEERRVWDTSLVVLTADHGEELFDHGNYEHGHNLFQELLRVPLVVWGPGVEKGRDPLAVTVADLAPTLLEAAGLESAEGMAGVSLWPRLRRGKRLPERTLMAESVLYGREKKAIVEWPYKMIWEPDSGSYVLFDLAADPGETRDLAPRRPALVARLGTLLQERLRWARRGENGPQIELDPEVTDE